MRLQMILWLFFSAFILTNVNAQNDGSKLKQIIGSAKAYQETIAPEKIYIHTDKADYFIGDTIWFKAYLFDKLSLAAAEKSKILYVELNNDSAINIKRISVPLSYGLGWAQFPLLPKQIREGSYTLRAYTNWMQNTGEESFFNKRIYIGKSSPETWRINSQVNLVDDKQINVNLKLSTFDKKPIASKSVQIQVRSGDLVVWRKDMQTTPYGDIAVSIGLNEKLPSGALRLYILNADPKDPPQTASVPLDFNRSNLIDLQFFPEGGNLVGGLAGKLAFKALNEDGKGANVSGAIFDSKNNKIVDFKTFYNGMGKIDFKPVSNEKYTAKLNMPTGATKIYQLPEVHNNGTLLSIVNLPNKDTLSVNLQFSSAIDKNSKFYIIGESRGFISYGRPVSVANASFLVPKNIFPSGIVHFSLLKDTIPVNERITYIKKEDNFKINFTKNADKYEVRDSIELLLDAKDFYDKAIKGGTFSVSVTDDASVSADTLGNDDITTSLLFTSDIRGFIENPSYYVNSNNTANWEALDNLLLTQGWIGLNWEEVFKQPKPKFAAEQSFVVNGKVTNVSKKPVEGAQMLISSQRPAFLKETVTDANGVYQFDNLPPLDTASFFILARTPKGRTFNFGEVSVNKFIAPQINYQLPSIKPWYVNSSGSEENAASNANKKSTFSPTDGQMLREVEIKGNKLIPNSFNTRGSDLAYNAKEIKESGATDIYTLLQQMSPSFKVVNKNGFAAVMFGTYAMEIRMDGQSIRLQTGSNPSAEEVITELKRYGVASLAGVEVLYSRRFTQQKLRSATASPVSSATSTGLQMMSDISSGSTGSLSTGNTNSLTSNSNNTGLSNSNLGGFSQNSINNNAGGSLTGTSGQGGGGSTSGQPSFLSYIPDEHDFRYTAWVKDRLARYDANLGIIEITTKDKTGSYLNMKNNSAYYRPVNTIYPKEFYSPKYINKSDFKAPDLRTTIYWKPDVVTDMNGKAKVSFYAGDKKTTYTVILQGADLLGGIGNATYKLKIE